ncbi:unnamed protein product [Didymodactylos carnosus]|uniref:ubiquitinyl hydrolase 1 n=1 Tax=Didymodactylos carnosus TaxID=1234261 RepID=A0A8S2DD52_9BILA|nr:unnamed protein product [Didymodactylos carnosus]CAF3681206.1 unnamed protein product [Didymodactylos carnosus]
MNVTNRTPFSDFSPSPTRCTVSCFPCKNQSYLQGTSWWNILLNLKPRNGIKSLSMLNNSNQRLKHNLTECVKENIYSVQQQRQLRQIPFSTQCKSTYIDECYSFYNKISLQSGFGQIRDIKFETRKLGRPSLVILSPSLERDENQIGILTEEAMVVLERSELRKRYAMIHTENFGLAIDEKYVVAVGGNDLENHPLTNCYISDLKDHEGNWIALPHLPAPTSGPGVGMLDGQIHCVGGFDIIGSESIALGEYLTLSYPNDTEWHYNRELEVARARPLILIIQKYSEVEKQIYAAGGYDVGADKKPFIVADVWTFSEERRKWLKVTDIPELELLHGLSYNDNKLHISETTEIPGKPPLTNILRSYDLQTGVWKEENNERRLKIKNNDRINFTTKFTATERKSALRHSTSQFKPSILKDSPSKSDESARSVQKLPPDLMKQESTIPGKAMQNSKKENDRTKTKKTSNGVMKKVLKINENSTKPKTKERSQTKVVSKTFSKSTLKTGKTVSLKARKELLRDYFLLNKHVCSNKTQNETVSTNSNLTISNCILCEMNRLCRDIYSHHTVNPYIPSQLLYLIWTHENHLAGFEEQDAQEFLMALFNIIHSQNTTEASRLAVFSIRICNIDLFHLFKAKDGKNCSCVIDKIFNGTLQSDVTCSRCGNVSIKEDPIRDISLQLDSTNCTNRTHETFTLETCLRRFTHSETLSNFYCDHCELSMSATIKLTIAQAPVVACFHLKRFQYIKKSRSRSRKKISSHVAFSEYFDLTPYLSSTQSEINENKQQLSTKNNNLYFLFAVISHFGLSAETGHYICYIKLNHNRWFRCDDHLVSEVNNEEVFNSECYLLFYQRFDSITNENGFV